MLKDIKQLGKETAIYGISTIVGRFWNFILVPLYTNFFSQQEYGIITNIYAVLALLNIIYLYGMDSAYMKFAASAEKDKEKKTFSTAFLTLLISSLLLSAIILLFRYSTADFLELDYFQLNIVYYFAIILLFDNIASVPFARLRLNNKAFLFAGLKTLNIFLNLFLNIIFIFYLRYSIDGVFLAAAITSVITFITLLPVIIKNFVFNIDWKLFKELIRFGLPFVPAGLASMMVQVINRPIMLKLTDAATVGVFQANYKLGIFMMLIVSMFQYAWQPFFFNNSQRPDAKLLFSKVLTYFTIFSSVIFFMLSLFIEDLVKIPIGNSYLIGKNFWEGLYIVPIILLAYLFNGLYINFIAGIQITKQTKYLPLISGAGAIVTILANYLLIPVLNMLGAAIATLLSYVIMAYLMYKFSQKFYPIDYEWEKIRKVFILLAVCGAYVILALKYINFNVLIIKLSALTFYLLLLNIFKLIDLSNLKSLLKHS